MLLSLPRKGIARGLIAFLTFHAFSAPLFAEDRSLTAILPTNYLNYTVRAGELPATLKRPAHLRSSRTLYTEYFQPLDQNISSEYRNNWAFRDLQTTLPMTPSNYEYLALGGSDYGERDPGEQKFRSEFAQRVLRLRIDRAVRTYLESQDRPQFLRKGHNAFFQMRDMPLRFSQDESRGELRVGYDVSTDSSKLEYVRGSLEAGLYQPQLLSSLMGQYPMNQTRLRVRTEPGLGLPNTALAYQFSEGLLEAVLTKPLSPSVIAEFSSAHPVGGQKPTSVVMKMIYNF